MAVGDVFRVEVVQQMGSVPSMNVLHVRQTVAEAVDEDLAKAVVEMVTTAYDGIKAHLSNEWRVILVSARNIIGLNKIPETLVLGGAEAIQGAIVGERLPSNAPAVCSLYSLKAGKSGRGRVYISGVPENDADDGQFVELAYTGFAAKCKTVFEGEKGPFLAGAAKFRFHVWTTLLGGAVPQGDVVKALLRVNLGSMRSRRAFPGFAPA